MFGLDFNKMKKDPIMYVFTLLLGVIGYLYVDLKQTTNERIQYLESELKESNERYQELQRMIIPYIKK